MEHKNHHPHHHQHPSQLVNYEPTTYIAHSTDRIPIITKTIARSLNNKRDLLSQFLTDSKTDIAAVTKI